MGQMRFADLDWAAKKKPTRRARFLSEMNQLVPWQRLIGRIRHNSPKAGGGRQPKPWEWIIRYLRPLWSRNRIPPLRHRIDAAVRGHQACRGHPGRKKTEYEARRHCWRHTDRRVLLHKKSREIPRHRDEFDPKNDPHGSDSAISHFFRGYLRRKRGKITLAIYCFREEKRFFLGWKRLKICREDGSILRTFLSFK